MQKVFHHEGLELSYLDQGSGPPIVLLHGFPFDHTMWNPQIKTLSATYRVIAPELRGFGNSSLTESDVSEGIAMSRYASDTIALLDHLQIDQPCILCGFSMGGYVLWQLALNSPERFRAIVPCDTRAIADSPEVRASRLKLATEILQPGARFESEAMLEKLLSPQTLAERPNLVQQVKQMMDSSDTKAIAAASRGMAAREDVRDRLSNITMPTLLVVGSDDAISSPAEMRKIASAMPTAEVVEIANAGHMTTLENPEAVNSAIQSFADSLGSREAIMLR